MLSLKFIIGHFGFRFCLVTHQNRYLKKTSLFVNVALGEMRERERKKSKKKFKTFLKSSRLKGV